MRLMGPASPGPPHRSVPPTRTQLSVTSRSARTSPPAESARSVTLSGVAIPVEISQECSSILEAKYGRSIAEGSAVGVASCCGLKVSLGSPLNRSKLAL